MLAKVGAAAFVVGASTGAAAQLFRGDCAFSETVAFLLLGLLVGLPIPGVPEWLRQIRGGSPPPDEDP